MIKLNCLVISFLLFSSNPILSSELSQDQIYWSESKRQPGREKYLAILKKRNPDFVSLGSQLTLENKNPKLIEILEILNLFILQDQDWETFSRRKLISFIGNIDKSGPILPLADLFLRIWYYGKFSTEIHDNLFEQDRNALDNICLNSNNRLVLRMKNYSYHLDTTKGKHFIEFNGEITAFDNIDQDLLARVNKTLLNHKKAYQTKQQVGFAAIVIVLLIYSVCSK